MALDYKTGLSRYRRYLQVVQEQPLWGASLWLILTLILITVMIVVALRPTLVTIAGLLGQKKQLVELSDRMDKKIAALTEAEAGYNSLTDKLYLLDEGLPKDLNWASWSDQLWDTASNSGVAVTRLELKKMIVAGEEIDVKPNTPVKTEEVKELPTGVKGLNYLVTVTGDYNQFQEFIAGIEKMRRINVISTVRIQRNDTGVLVLEVEGIVGYYPGSQKTL